MTIAFETSEFDRAEWLTSVFRHAETGEVHKWVVAELLSLDAASAKYVADRIVERARKAEDKFGLGIDENDVLQAVQDLIRLGFFADEFSMGLRSGLVEHSLRFCLPDSTDMLGPVKELDR